MTELRRVIINALVIGISLAFLLLFALIGIYGKIYIQEPNINIFSLELFLLTAILSFGVLSFVKDARKHEDNDKQKHDD